MATELTVSEIFNTFAKDDTCDGSPSKSGSTLSCNNSVRLRVERMLNDMLIHSPHSFQTQKVEIFCSSYSRSSTFKSHLKSYINPNPHLMFHGSKESNHDSIFDNGFSLDSKYWGDADLGFLGKGIYVTPHPEYSASFIKESSGITRFAYTEPVQMGYSCKLLGCLVIVGRKQQLYQKQDELGQAIPSYLESNWAWVDKDGSPTAVASNNFAREYAIKTPVDVYPRFRITLKRVSCEVIWVDPNISNSENSGYINELKQNQEMFLYATSSSSKALECLKKQKSGTTYRAITAGRGGESFVSDLRSARITCNVLVFCGAVDYHKTWAKKFSNVEVTSLPKRMKEFASWK